MNRRSSFIYIFLLFFFSSNLFAQQSFYSTPGSTIPAGYGTDMFDTLNVSGLTPLTIDSTFGLDSVSLNISYDYDPGLVISLIAPDGSIVHLSDEFGTDSNFTNTCFTMSVNNFANDASSPMTGTMQPSQWLGIVNNGQAGNGYWVLHIVNNTYGPDTGILINWGLTFDSTPAPPAFFDSSTLPIIVINTYDVVIPTYNDNDVPGYMGIIYNGSGINHLSDPFNNYNGYIGIHTRGNSTQSFPAKSYEMTTEDASGNDLDAYLLGMDTDHSWALYQPWDDKTLIRDEITYRLSNDMGDYASRTHLCELLLDGDYRGVYVLEDHISRGSNRVAVHKMATTDNTAPNVTGGYIFEVDRPDDPGYDSWTSAYTSCDSSTSPISFDYAYPKPENIDTSQAQYIAAYVDSFETALKTMNLYDTVNGYRRYIDVPSFMDQSLLQEVGHNVDGYRLSSYLHKDRSGKLMGGPIWDFNEAYGNSDYYDGSDYSTWEWDFPCPFYDQNLNPFWWRQFVLDSNYYNELKCRYTTFRHGALSNSHIDTLIDSLINVLAVPEQRHYRRWPIIGVYTWPQYYVETSYADAVNYMKGWIDSRLSWMDSNLYNPACLIPPTTYVQQLTPGTVSIYPNPASDEFNITANEMINNVCIYNVIGQKVYENTTPSKTYTIQLSGRQFPPGIYNVMLQKDSGTVRRKIVIAD